MKERFRRFMQGRYGADDLSRALMVVVIIAFVAGMFTDGMLSIIFSAVGWASILFAYIRMFSKNYTACWAQNQKYLSAKNRFLGFFKKQKHYAAQRKTHHIYTCPSCGQKIRVPKGKGKIEVRCPKCSTTFIKRS
ncbi:MAG: hypothetical protein Q4B70_06540 [Lachnospiraceae bacterium]|nr:hypothetical protein [Lachnospiraceae bacterium]